VAKLPRVEPDDPITDGFLNALIEAAGRCRLEVGSGLQAAEGPTGTVLSTVVSRPFYAKITGALSGGTYPFTEQFTAAGGTWTAGNLTGVAYEQNSYASVPTNTYVIMRWVAAGYYQFAAGSCP
jgi:hypothetical protein